jgi:Zn-dependent peptidase ImmA (M78 family)
MDLEHLQQIEKELTEKCKGFAKKMKISKWRYKNIKVELDFNNPKNGEFQMFSNTILIGIENLDNESLDFILAHEIGHVKDIYLNFLPNFMIPNILLRKREYKADLLAAKIGFHEQAIKYFSHENHPSYYTTYDTHPSTYNRKLNIMKFMDKNKLYLQ